ncbi:hypothetical protein T439DRAFT_144019 [Meredithblackwellia eburnea MCA 4105]
MQYPSSPSLVGSQNEYVRNSNGLRSLGGNGDQLASKPSFLVLFFPFFLGSLSCFRCCLSRWVAALAKGEQQRKGGGGARYCT